MTDTVTTLGGQQVALPAVYLFVTNWVLPILVGPLVAGLTQLWKQAGWLELPPGYSAAAQTWLTRGVVALACVVLNVLGGLAVGEPVTWSALGQLLLSYFAAVTAYEHAKPAAKEPEGQEEQAQ